MPEYITKNEPVDKKPYIVYTGDKNIVYSGDPDTDIPGGGGASTVKCYMVDAENPSTPLDTDSVIVEDFNGASVVVSEDSFVRAGETVNCVSFTATVGEAYAIANREISGGELIVFSNQNKNLPSTFDNVNATLSFIAYKEPMLAVIERIK